MIATPAVSGPRAGGGGRRRLRIAVFHDLPSGGAKRTVHAQVRGLVARGHEVGCFVTSTAEESLLPLRDVAHRVVTVPVPAPPDRERALAGQPTPGDVLRWARVLRGVGRAGRAVAAAVRADGFDLLLVHPSQFTQAPHVLSRASLPTVYYCHEVLRAAHEPGISGPLVRFAIRHTLGRIDRRNARSADVLVANSEYTAGRIQAVYGRSAVVAPPGVDLETFRPARAGRSDYVLSVGALHPLKGLDLAVDAVGAMRPGGRPPLIIVSDRRRQAEEDRIRERAERADVELEIRYRVSEDELVALYSAARAVVYTPHREPLGLVPLEAMACGTPVVAVAEGGIPETVVDGRTGRLVPRDADALAAALDALLEDAERADAMGRAARALVEAHWGWGTAVDRLEAILEMAVKP